MSVVDQYPASMRSLPLVLLLAAGCGAVGINPDAAALANAGCRAPAACFSTTCSCVRPLPGQKDPCQRDCVFTMSTDMPTCECVMGDVCIEPAQECVGRAVAPCPGVGARCLPAGSSCASSAAGDPPDVVGANSGDPDAGPTTEQRCPYVDDVCCPGMTEPIDLGVLDANLIQSIGD